MTERLDVLPADGSHAAVIAELATILGQRENGTRLLLTYESDEPFGELRAIAVAEGFRRRGVARRLLRAAESMPFERGARIIVLSSGSHRADAHLFYEAQGHSFTGRRYRTSS